MDGLLDTRSTYFPFGTKDGEVVFPVMPQGLLDLYDVTLGEQGVGGVAKRSLLGEPVTGEEMFDAALNYGATMMTPQAVGALAVRPDPNTLLAFAGPKAKNFPAFRDIDQTRLEQLKIKYETAPDMDSKRAAIEEYEQELASVKSQKQEKLAEATGILDESSSQAGGLLGTERRYGTGLFRLPDNQVRFEIDDRDAKVVFPDFEADKVTSRVPNFPQESRFTDEFSKKVFNKEFNLGDVFKHPELYDNYPDFKNIKVQFVNDPDASQGSFNPNLNLIKVNLSPFKDAQKDGLPTDLLSDRIADILVHEVQHSIQDLEGFAKGGNYAVAQMVGEQAKKKTEQTLRDTAFSEKIYNQRRKELFDVSDAKAIQSYQEMAKRETFQPRSIKKTSDWYKYGDKIRGELFQELGYAEPKKKGPKRDLWHKAAFAKMAQYARDENPNASALADNFNAKELEKQSKDISKNLRPLLEDVRINRAAQDMMTEFYPAGRFYDFDDNMQSRHNIYENLLGEAEARAVQARRGSTLAGTGGLLYDAPVYTEYTRQAFPFNQFERGGMKSPPPLGLLGTFVKKKY